MAVVGTPAFGDGPAFDGTKYVNLPLVWFGLCFVFPVGSVAGAKVAIPAPFAGAFAAWHARLDDGGGSAAFQVNRANGIAGAFAGVGGTQPAVTSALGAEDTTGLDWTTSAFNAGDPIEVVLVSLSVATSASLTINCYRI